MSATSPGPWAPTFLANGGYDCLTDAILITDATRQPVALLDFAHYGQPRGGEARDADRATANGALIAKAPELRDLLREFVASYDGAADMIGPLVKDRLERARAVLAQVEGGAR